MINTNVISLNLEVKNKQDIKMPGKRGRIIPKGTKFVWDLRTQMYIAKIDGGIVCTVSSKYVDTSMIFESFI